MPNRSQLQALAFQADDEGSIPTTQVSAKSKDHVWEESAPQSKSPLLLQAKKKGVGLKFPMLHHQRWADPSSN